MFISIYHNFMTNTLFRNGILALKVKSLSYKGDVVMNAII